MNLSVSASSPEAVAGLRTLFLHELNRQFILDKCYRYGWADVYAFTAGGEPVGYGAVWGTHRRQDRDAIFEFYLLPPHRRYAHETFTAFRALSGATYIECQTNDALLFSLLSTHCPNIRPEAILFDDAGDTALSIPGAALQPLHEEQEGAGCQYQLLHKGAVVATGGLMLNYNPPYADIYMEVPENQRGHGYGSYIVQELKKEAYRTGRRPVARCNVQNRVSQNTLQRAGMAICGYRMVGTLA